MSFNVQQEKHKAKKDPENAQGHKIAEEIAETAAVGDGDYAFHEHKKWKEFKKEMKNQIFQPSTHFLKISFFRRRTTMSLWDWFQFSLFVRSFSDRTKHFNVNDL